MKKLYNTIPLIPGSFCSIEDISQYVAHDDIKSVKEWFRSRKSLKFYYRPMPIDTFEEQITTAEQSYKKFPNDAKRTQKIVNILKNGGLPYCVFVEAQDFSYSILEGRHRIVAFNRMNMDSVPVIFVYPED
jgi:hypothetical protein